LVDEAGFPPGVWNVVHGEKKIVNAILDHPDIVGITIGSFLRPMLKNKGLRTYGRVVASSNL